MAHPHWRSLLFLLQELSKKEAEPISPEHWGQWVADVLCYRETHNAAQLWEAQNVSRGEARQSAIGRLALGFKTGCV